MCNRNHATRVRGLNCNLSTYSEGIHRIIEFIERCGVVNRTLQRINQRKTRQSEEINVLGECKIVAGQGNESGIADLLRESASPGTTQATIQSASTTAFRGTFFESAAPAMGGESSFTLRPSRTPMLSMDEGPLLQFELARPSAASTLSLPLPPSTAGTKLQCVLRTPLFILSEMGLSTAAISPQALATYHGNLILRIEGGLTPSSLSLLYQHSYSSPWIPSNTRVQFPQLPVVSYLRISLILPPGSSLPTPFNSLAILGFKQGADVLSSSGAGKTSKMLGLAQLLTQLYQV